MRLEIVQVSQDPTPFAPAGVEPSESVGRPSSDDMGWPLEIERSPLSSLNDRTDLPRGTETILLVEDGPLCRVLAMEILVHLGYRVLEASDPNEALDIHRGHPNVRIHLLLTDIVMESMSGDDLAAVMTAERPELKVLLTSGYPDGGASKGITRPRTTPFLPKPYTPLTLARMVHKVLHGRRAA